MSPSMWDLSTADVDEQIELLIKMVRFAREEGQSDWRRCFAITLSRVEVRYELPN